MNNRERWTVYPLLFLAIGLAVRAGIASREPFDTLRGERLDAGQVVCRELVVTGSDGVVIVHIGRVRDGGGGRIVGPGGDPLNPVAGVLGERDG